MKFLPALSTRSLWISLLGFLTLSSPTKASSTSSSSSSHAFDLRGGATAEQATNTKRLTLETMSQTIRKMEYAVRGAVVIAADKISEELKEEEQKQADSSDDPTTKKTSKYPFDHIVYTNIGNPQSVGQKPLTWPRQVLALVDLPDSVGVDHPDAAKLFPADALSRAREIKAALGGSGSGAYTHSKGAKCFRNDVASFLQARDDLPADPEDIYLTNGASAGITMILNALIANSNCGVMIPIPQYPIYSATIDLYNGKKVGYFLNEANDWELRVEDLEKSLLKAKADGIQVNCFVLINPGNPTGQVLTRENLHEVIRFCHKHNLVLLADEVYQENVYDEHSQFISCKRAAHEVGLLDQIELVSFHSTSKGVFGECGRRGGYMELVGFDPAVKQELYKLASAFLCSTVSGQCMTALMARGPAPTDESYASHEAEKQAIFKSLQARSRIVSQGLDRIEGFSCQPAKGSMYCFPSVQMPVGAIEAAKKQGTSPDALYCVSLLKRTGICTVPASGFGQEEGRYGFRTTFLPPKEEMTRVVDLIQDHYQEFLQEYK